METIEIINAIMKVVAIGKFIQNLKGIPSEYENFIIEIKKSIRHSCNMYRELLEKSYDHISIEFYKEHEDEITDNIINALSENKEIVREMILSKEGDFPECEKIRLFELIVGNLHLDSFQFMCRQNFIKDNILLSEIKNNIELLREKLEKIEFIVDVDGGVMGDRQKIQTMYHKKEIWDAIKNEYCLSKGHNGRFSNLKILENLFPHGYATQKTFTEHGKIDNGIVSPLNDLIAENEIDNISIIGSGGIGKTTFLCKLMADTYEKEYEENLVMPIFIEVNRCSKKNRRVVF
jgi:hypothetical protein